MHDPMSVAHEIRFPWFRTVKFGNGGAWRYWVPFITIWHNDPERDGSDNSCDWCGWKPEPSESVERELRSMASWEEKYPFYFNRTMGPADAAALVYCFWQTIAWRTNYTTSWWKRLLDPQRRRKIPRSFFMRAVSYCANETDNILMIFQVEPNAVFPREDVDRDGIHRVSKPSLDAEASYRKFRRLWQFLMSERRPWWRHPKWHIHHWSLQIHPWQAFKRWFAPKEKSQTQSDGA